MTIGYICDIGGPSLLHPVIERFGMVPLESSPSGTWKDCDAVFIEWAFNDAARWLRYTHEFGDRVPPVIVRCHSFEVFQSEWQNIKWENAAAVIFVADHVLAYAKEKWGFSHPNTHVIPCGIDTDRYTPPPDKQYGKVIGFVGSLNHKKGPMLLAQVIKAVTDYDPEFEFRLCGREGDPRFTTYFWHMLEQWGIRDNVSNLGWLDDMRPFYHSCDYILSTSPWEGTAQCIGEGIASGCIPLVHAWPGAREQYPAAFVWSEVWELFDRLAVGAALTVHHPRAYLPTQSASLDALGAVIEHAIKERA